MSQCSVYKFQNRALNLLVEKKNRLRKKGFLSLESMEFEYQSLEVIPLVPEIGRKKMVIKEPVFLT